MVEEQMPVLRVIKFEQTFEKRAERDEYGDKVLDANGNQIIKLQEEDWVTYAPSHNPISTQTRERIRHIIPNETIKDSKNGVKSRFFEHRWNLIKPAYEAWKNGNEIPIDGTALGQWPGLTTPQVDALKSCSIRTVEEVRDMTDGQCDRVRMPNVRDLRKSAAAFLDNAIAAEAAHRETERDDKISNLEEKLEAAMALLEVKAIGETDDEVDQLRAELDTHGIKYHHKHKAPKLRELLELEAA